MFPSDYKKSILLHSSGPWPAGPLKILPKGSLFNESRPLGKRPNLR